MIKFLSDEENWCAKEDRAENLIYARMDFQNDERYVNFAVDTSEFALNNYIKQWKNAANYALQFRQTAAFFTSFFPSQEVFASTLFIITPKEILKPISYAKYANKKSNKMPQSFYLTEGIFYLTTKLEVLNNSAIFQKLYKTCNTNLPIYFVNPDNFERFYPYIPATDAIEIQKGCWCRKVEKQDLIAISNL
ncbi:MAG: hypothetical protein J6M05_04805 [Cardiobacteriaceae bacterium]|nr:hypothetical protein [Cardiobacteriaceae bacterium]